MKPRGRKVMRRYRQDPEGGQAMVEFALILIPFLIVTSGIIYFGIGLNYWLDMNRVANQGARWAVVNNWPPQCMRGDVCNSSNAGTPCSTVLGTSSKARLQDVLRCSPRNSSTVTVCYPGVSNPPANATIGEPVKIKLTAPYTFFFMRHVGITLTASATMRLEQVPQASLTTSAGGPTC